MFVLDDAIKELIAAYIGRFTPKRELAKKFVEVYKQLCTCIDCFDREPIDEDKWNENVREYNRRVSSIAIKMEIHDPKLHISYQTKLGAEESPTLHNSKDERQKHLKLMKGTKEQLRNFIDENFEPSDY